MDRCSFTTRTAFRALAAVLFSAFLATHSYASGATSQPVDSIPAPRGYLGLVVPVRGTGGARVVEVLSDGPAAFSGILPGDLVLAVEKRAVDDPPSLAAAMISRMPGERVAVTLRRGATLLERSVTLAPAPRPAPSHLSSRDFLKADLRDLWAELRAAGRRLTGRIGR